MADINYSVQVTYDSVGDVGTGLTNGVANAQSKVKDLQKRLATGIGGAFTSFGSGLSSLLSKPFEALEGIVANAHLLKGVFEIAKIGIVGFNAEIEEMKIGMAGIFTSSGVANTFGEGLEMSAHVIKTMRKDAADLPGEFKDLVNIMRTISTPAIQSGLTVRETENMAKRAMAIGIGTGLRSDVIAREFAALIEGRAKSQNVLGMRLPGLSLHGDAAKKFNAMSTEDRIATLQKALGMKGGAEQDAYEGINKHFAKSWIGRTSALKDNLRGLAGAVTEPLFERMKSTLGWVNDWFSSNNALDNWVERAGRALATSFSMAFKVVMEIEAKLHGIIDKVVPVLSKHAKEGKLGGEIMDVVGGAVAMKGMASVASPIMSGVGSVLQFGFSPGGMKALETVGEALAGLAGTGEGVIVIVGGIVAAFTTMIAWGTALFGVYDALTDELSPFHELAMAVWNDIKVRVVESVMNLKAAFDSVLPTFKNLADLLGVAILAAVDLAAMAFQKLTEVIKGLATGAAWVLNKLGVDYRLEGVKPKEIWEREHPSRFTEDALNRKAPAPPNHTTHVHKVEIKVNSNQDPERIAKSTFRIFSDQMKNPLSSPYSPRHRRGPGEF